MAGNKQLQHVFLLLIFSSLQIYIHTASIATEEDECPVRNKHCNCSGGPFYTIFCNNISDFKILEDVTDNFTEKTFIFELESLNWTSFPIQQLESPFLRSLIIKKSNFEILFNASESTVMHESSAIHDLSLENVTTTSEWSWDQLHFLKKLDIFFAYNTTIGENLPSNFSQHMSKSLKFLSISQSNLSTVESECFKDLKNLTYLRISHSKLRTLTRDILPSPSKLGQLRLDHNLISSLPDDMFQNMPNLTVISLSNNRISVLPEELFRPLWRPNVYLELRNNPIKCDSRMRWIVTSPNKPNIIGECNYPKKIFGKNIKDLTEEDLDC